MKEEIFDAKTMKALKQCLLGTNTKEITSEYVLDEEEGKMKIVKQKISEKSLPPNTDLLKMILSQMQDEGDQYEKMSDEQLLQEKERLKQQLKK